LKRGRQVRQFAAVAVAALLALLAARALAQPMMIDPSRMSGIPRPDPQVPAGTVTVRLIRGELSNRLVGMEVELRQLGDGTSRKAKTDENGRATFSGLGQGPYQAFASDGKEQLSTEEFTLEPSMGVRVMLVFKAAGAAEPGATGEGAVAGSDGAGVADPSLPPGTVVVRARDGDGKPLAGLDVVLGQARAGESQVRERKARTDGAGEARFEGLDAKPTSGYLAEALRDGARFAGKPFRLTEKMGARVTLELRPVSRDLAALSIGAGSHVILEVGDDAVQVSEVLRVHNAGLGPVELPGGLHLPLPARATSAAVGPESPPGFSAAGHEAVLKGSLSPGDTELQVMFLLPYEGDSLELRQKTPLGFESTAVVTEKIDGLAVSGDRLESEEREFGGRKLMLLRGPGTAPGGELALRVTGLPKNDATWRYAAAALAVALLIGFGFYARRAAPPSPARLRLEQRREKLLDELVAVERRAGGDADKRARRRTELADKLAEIYRELDEVER
jgi:hypothetical protein